MLGGDAVVTVQTDLEEATSFIRRCSPLRPKVGLVLGSGLSAFASALRQPTRIPYREVPHFPTPTAVGHPGELAVGAFDGIEVAVLTGRAHLYEGYSARQVVFPVRTLGRLGVEILLVTNAAGSVNVNYRPGDLMVIEDHINLTGANPLVGPPEDQLGERFIDLSDAYDAELRTIAWQACRKAKVPVHKGTYIAFSGPSYETPAEIHMARLLGADAVGMSTVPEVIAARQIGMRVLGLSCLTNMAAGVLKKKLDHQEVLEVAERVKQSLMEVLGHIIREAAKQP
jgi:purine-nucleoside phosphorylase